MSNRNWTGFSLSALGAAVAIVAAAPAMAQNTTAAINGRISAADGKAVSGATVTIVHRESGSTNTLTTDAEGRYAARGLRVGGPYDITIAKGSDKEARSGIFLALAENLNLDVRLGSQQLQTVTITGTASASSKFNSGTMGAGTSIGRNELDAYASINRNLQDYARTDPRLSQTDKERGEISAAGQNVRYNSVTIDGVTVNDTFGLEANNMPTVKQPISIDAIQSVQVNLSNYDVTQKGYTGANINAVTKSGTNELKGSVYYVYRNDKMAGSRYNRAADTYFSFLPFKEETKGFTLGGPIIKDKLFFFASYEELKSNRAQPEFGPVGSALTNVAISQNILDQLKASAKSKYGIDVGDSLADSPLTVKESLIKVDWNINDKHRANVRFARTKQDETVFGSFSATAVNLTSWWYTYDKKIDTVVGQLFSDWTPNFSTEVKISNRDYDSIPHNNSKLPSMALSFAGNAPIGSPAGINAGTRFVNFGTELSRHYNILQTKTQDAYFGANWAIDDHEVKFGADYQKNKVFNAFFQNANGNYTFNCSNGWSYDAIPGEKTGYVLGAAGNKSCTGSNGLTTAQMEAAVLENFLRGRPSSYTVQVPVAGGTLDDGIARWALAQTGLFVQDTWTVSDRLTLTAGVRVDSMSTNDKPTYNAAAAAATIAGSVSGTTVTRNTGGFGLDNSATVDGKNLVQPRFGFNYLLSSKKDDKAQIRGGFGLFQGAAANVWLTNPFSNTGLATRITGCGGSFAACPSTGIAFSVDPANQPTSFGNAAANVDFVQKGLGQPSVWKMNLAYDGQLPWGGLEWSAEWLYTKTDSGIYYKHLNLGAATKVGPDGRELYYTPQGYDRACWTATGGTNTTGACTGFRNRALSNASYSNVLMAAETKKGGGNTITLSLGQPSRGGFGWQVAYTHQAATEVSPLTSSISNSSFNARAIFNPNEESTGNSAALIKDRVSAALNWSKAFIGNYKTTVGLFYEGRKGKPYSWTYRNDMNGDGVVNDLMYIPTAFGSGEVEFLGDTATSKVNETNFWGIVDSYKELRDAKGGVVKRFGSLSPWVNSFDLRISQQIPGFSEKHKGTFSFDILNVGNLINPKWGRTNEVAFASAGGNKRTFVNYVGINSAGKYIYQVNTNIDDLTLKQVKGESQWAVQATARYEF